MTERQLEKVTFTGAQETTLATLYGKAMESRKPESILRDEHADRALQHVDYDFSRLKIRASDHRALAVRAKAYDGWAREFIARHPECTVLHLGCGLDTRSLRLEPPAGVRWYDIDYPDVIDVRRRLFPARDGVQAVASSVTDPHLLDGISGDTPVLVIAEGLTPYLRAVDGLAMLRRITEHFAGGELLFDGYNRAGVWFLQRYGCVKASAAQLDWSIGDPREVERAVPGLILDRELWYADAPGVAEHFSPAYRALLRAVYLVRPLRRLGRPLRYRFGAAGAGSG